MIHGHGVACGIHASPGDDGYWLGSLKVMVEFMGKVVVESKYIVLDMESMFSMGNTVGFLGPLVVTFKGWCR